MHIHTIMFSYMHIYTKMAIHVYMPMLLFSLDQAAVKEFLQIKRWRASMWNSLSTVQGDINRNSGTQWANTTSVIQKSYAYTMHSDSEAVMDTEKVDRNRSEDVKIPWYILYKRNNCTSHFCKHVYFMHVAIIFRNFCDITSATTGAYSSKTAVKCTQFPSTEWQRAK